MYLAKDKVARALNIHLTHARLNPSRSGQERKSAYAGINQDSKPEKMAIPIFSYPYAILYGPVSSCFHSIAFIVFILSPHVSHFLILTHINFS